MHPTAVAKLVDEIAPRIEGAKITDAYAPGEGCLIVELGEGARLFFGVSTLKALPLMFATDATERIPRRRRQPRPGIEGELAGARIVELRSVGDGIAELAFRKALVTGRSVDRVLSIDLGRRPRLAVRDAGAPGSGSGPADDRETAEEAPAAGGPSVAWRHDDAGRIHVRISTSGAPGRAEASTRFESVNEAALFAFGEFWARLELERRRSAVARRIATALKRKRRAIRKVRAEIEAASAADDLRRRGHLVLTRQSQIRRGAGRVTVPDYDGETPVEIVLDPALTPAQNAEALFRRARKAARKAEAAPRRLADLEEEERRLVGLADSVGAANDDEIAKLESEFRAQTPKRGRAAGAGIRARYRTYTVSGGWEVLVGKSNRDNDVLTHRIARPSDLWFHVRQAAGSHVILRRHGKKAEPDRQAILEAAAIAAFHSKAGKATKVPVCYTERRHVRKPRGARPGLAVVSREKVVFVEPKLPGSQATPVSR
jgi:predicted ribosome quality control (RQC) complex YloA/Tae2 family protein